MEQINSPRKTRSGKVLGSARAPVAGVALGIVEEIIGREMAEEFIDLTEDYIDVDDYDGDATDNEVNNDGNILENVVEVIGGDDDNVTIVEDGIEDAIGENGMNVEDDLSLTVDLTNSPPPPPRQNQIKFPVKNKHKSSPSSSSTSASSSSCASTSASNGSSSVSCRICLDSQSDLEKEGHHLLSTVCGHIFCSKCLPTHIKKRGLCPICRRVLRPKDFHQIFL